MAQITSTPNYRPMFRKPHHFYAELCSIRLEETCLLMDNRIQSFPTIGLDVVRSPNMAWLPRSPDLTPLGFLLRGIIKSKTFIGPTTIDKEDLKSQVILAF